MKTKAVITILITAAILQGCISVERTGEGHRYRSDTPTLGQELLDLERARSNGAISSAEFDRLKERIIETDAPGRESEAGSN